MDGSTPVVGRCKTSAGSHSYQPGRANISQCFSDTPVSRRTKRGGGSGDDLAFRQALRPLGELADHFELGEYLVQGLRRQYTRETAPDIKLINKKGYYFERDFDKYGHHGSYYPDDCIVSFWVAGPGLSQIIPDRHSLKTTASTLDLVPMVTHLLGIPTPPGLDGTNPLANLPTSGTGSESPRDTRN